MIIVEGIDGAGKTTLVNTLVQKGFSKHHFDYDVKNMDLVSKYLKVLKNNHQNLVIDRSFISEMVYGPVLRGKSKLTLEDYKKLLFAYKKVNTKIIYLKASKEVLLLRKGNEIDDYNMIKQYYKALNTQYNNIMNYSKDIIKVMTFDTELKNPNEILVEIERRN